MALTTNNWSVITLNPASDASWTAYPSTLPTLPSAITDLLINAGVTALRVFCVDDSGPLTLAFSGGTVILDAGVIATDTPVTTNVQIMDNFDTWYSARNGTEWLCYSYIQGQVFTLADSTVLGAFIS